MKYYGNIIPYGDKFRQWFCLPQTYKFFVKTTPPAYIHPDIHTSKLFLWETMWEMCKTVENPNFTDTVKTQFIHQIVIIKSFTL